MKNFWQLLPRPFFVQAPMEDVTDTVFRQIIASCGKPDVFFTEFTNVNGIFSKGRDRVIHRFQYTDIERPLIAQIWGNNPENYLKAGQLIKEMGFDGVDINMGCPIHDVAGKGFCSGLINNPALAKELIKALKEGAGDMPVSVKTRIGYNTIKTEEWIGLLLEQGIDALTVHGRTVKEQSSVPAHWDEIGKVVELRDAMKVDTIIIGNGDIKTREEVKKMHEQYKVDGVMIGRGIFHNLWIFNKDVDPSTIQFKDKMKVLRQHLELFHKTWGKNKNFELLKKFYKIYTNDIPNASELRGKLMLLKTYEDTIKFLDEYLV